MRDIKWVVSNKKELDKLYRGSLYNTHFVINAKDIEGCCAHCQNPIVKNDAILEITTDELDMFEIHENCINDFYNTREGDDKPGLEF